MYVVNNMNINDVKEKIISLEELLKPDNEIVLDNFQKNFNLLIKNYLLMKGHVKSVREEGFFFTTQYNQNRCLKEFVTFMVKEFCPQHLNVLNNIFDTLYSDKEWRSINAEGQELFQKNIEQLCKVIKEVNNK